MNSNQSQFIKEEIPNNFQSILKLAHSGNLDAMNNIGIYYQTNSSKLSSLKKEYYLLQAAHWFTKAANQGFAPAQFSLGVCCMNGEGVLKDYHQGFLWYTRAAEQGYAPAQTNLGLCYEGGIGTTQDLPKAVYWWQKAAAKNYEPAKFFLGPYFRSDSKTNLKRSENSLTIIDNILFNEKKTEDGSDEELEVIEKQTRLGLDDIREYEESNEAFHKLKTRFKKKGGAAELRVLCNQFGINYTEKENTMRTIAENVEIRNILFQKKVI